MQYVDYMNILRDLVLDVTSLYLFAYWILYKKYNNKELFVSCVLFNISLLLVVVTIVRTDFNIAIGFGLFALLSLVTLRSATFAKSEMAYFFSGVALAVINGCGIADFYYLLLCNGIVVSSVWIIGSFSIDHMANLNDNGNIKTMVVVLDEIDQTALNNRSLMSEKMARRFNVEVVSINILRVDYVKDTIDVELAYRLADQSAHPVEETAGGGQTAALRGADRSTGLA